MQANLKSIIMSSSHIRGHVYMLYVATVSSNSAVLSYEGIVSGGLVYRFK